MVVTEDDGVYSTDYGFALARPKPSGGTVYQRNYTWNERNLMTRSSDPQIQVDYRYGADGQRTIKHSTLGEVMYFNTMWSVQTDIHSKLLQSKHIFVGSSRIVTKRNYKGESNLQYEERHQYYYHTDHLNSVQTVTDYEGRRFERLEYTPYGELWIEKRYSSIESTPFRFTGKELDPETGLYYYGARYLDPKYSRWLSTDPALGEYIPGAPVNEEVRKRNGNLPGLGGVYNTVNLHLYHYAGNNPVKFIDPDGREIKSFLQQQWSSIKMACNFDFGKDAIVLGVEAGKAGNNLDAAGWYIAGTLEAAMNFAIVFPLAVKAVAVISAQQAGVATAATADAAGKGLNFFGKPGPGVTPAQLKGLQTLADKTGESLVIHGSRQTGISVHTGKAFTAASDLDIGVIGTGENLQNVLFNPVYDNLYSKIPNATDGLNRIVPSVQEALDQGFLVVIPK